MVERIVHLAPGASGGPASMAPYVRGLAAAGITARAVQLPRGTAERALPVYRAAAPFGAETVVGGQSFGGRVGSLLAAEGEVGGLVLISYPLHPPGAPDRWDQRTEHWPQIACPVLLLSGDRDPFAKVGLLREAVGRLPRAELHIYPGVGHGLRSVLDEAVGRIAAFVRGLD
ncbi:MAG TPA: alpha/beta family hydrolase [Candidatus Limnocylindria bacterium]|nr:alpha/beta family hydrolase [Candidatus Limnocylindria bacterium]